MISYPDCQPTRTRFFSDLHPLNKKRRNIIGDIKAEQRIGPVTLGLTRSAIELGAGDWIYLDGGQTHSLKGIDDSSLLLTIFFDDEPKAPSRR